MRRGLLAGLVWSLCLMTNAFAIDETEPNDNWSEADTFTIGNPLAGSAYIPTDSDFWQFTVSGGEDVTFTHRSNGSFLGYCDWWIALYDSSYAELARSDAQTPSAVNNYDDREVIHFVFTSGGNYYFVLYVKSWDTTGQRYDVSTTWNNPPPTATATLAPPVSSVSNWEVFR